MGPTKSLTFSRVFHKGCHVLVMFKSMFLGRNDSLGHKLHMPLHTADV